MYAGIKLLVNGQEHRLELDGGTPLLYVLRNDLELNGPKYGCGLGQCGACAVLVDGVAARSCVLPLKAVAGRSVTTLEGMGQGGAPDPVQRAFIEEEAAQCGYCLNGMIITARAFLSMNPDPTEAQIREALRFNLCRCGTHLEIVRAVLRAASLLAAERAA
ncbi:MAG: (2Fe-2S)-binding protein [Noviherbaspirillum sp.]